MRPRPHAEHLHRLGPRALVEFLLELGRALDAAPAIQAQLEAWRSIDPALLRAVTETYCGGQQFPTTVQEVPDR
ncbi:hypothetical protein WDZ11_00945 [Roseomonas mucosa]|uniref:hypothetical protein n=1 Tax=Roseomonas mucosa TaxID=207340 RepID=UPI0028CDD7F7|nr:hypothetical protein [Roseomonas sp. DSM 102946]